MENRCMGDDSMEVRCVEAGYGSSTEDYNWRIADGTPAVAP